MRPRTLLGWAALALGVAVVVVAASRRKRHTPGQTALNPRIDAQLDEALQETFPASDPIAVGRIE